MIKVLVTGVGGFVGTYIAQYLSEQGYDVIGIVRTERDLDTKYKVIVSDISKKLAFCESVDIIVHIAGSLPYNTNSFFEYKCGNVDTMQNLIDYAKERSVKNFIYLSTIGIYGDFITEIVNEETKVYNPDDYGITKYFAEKLLKAETSINSISLRTPGIIGKGARGIWLTNLAEKLLCNENVTIYTPEFQTTNFVDVHDLAKFIDKMLYNGIPDERELLLACKDSASIKQIVYRMKENLKSNSEITVDNSIRKPFRLDAEKAHNLGYESMNPIEIVDKYCREYLDIKQIV